MTTFLTKTLLTLCFISAIGGFLSSSALALDNLESSIELRLGAGLDGGVDVSSSISRRVDTELLSVCCPDNANSGRIKFTLATPQKVSMCLFDQQGTEVVELLDRTETSGFHHISWDGCLKDGQLAHAGTYFLMMKTDDLVFLRRLVLE